MKERGFFYHGIHGTHGAAEPQPKRKDFMGA